MNSAEALSNPDSEVEEELSSVNEISATERKR
jgi:hypothetical protein